MSNEEEINNVVIPQKVPHPLYIGICLKYDYPAQHGIYIHDGFWNWDFHSKNHGDVDIGVNADEDVGVRDDAFDENCRDEKCLPDVLHSEIVKYIQDYQTKRFCKIIMAGLVNCNDEKNLREMARRLWKELDVLPCVGNATGMSMDEKACSVARKITQLLTPSGIPGTVQPFVGYRHEVEVDGNGKLAFSTLEDYMQTISKELAEKVIESSELVKQKEKSIVFFNSTPQGGGVAIIRHSTIRLYKLLGITARWYVMKPHPEVFEVTKKKFHNVLQGIAPPDTELSEIEKTHWLQWCKNNFETYWNYDGPLAKADVVVIDDPQPCGMIPLIKKLNPKAKLVYRSHIEIRSDLIEDENTVQHKVWSFLWDYICQCDYFVSHPVEKFIPKNVQEAWKEEKSIKVFQMPAITDPTDGLNKSLDNFAIDYYQILFNRISLDHTGYKINFSRPYFVQIARFDASKGIPDLIDAYIKFRKSVAKKHIGIEELPQLIITGNGSIDDPEGSHIYQETINYIAKIGKRKGHSPYVRDIYVIALGPSDQMLNAILTKALCAFQLSIREGFEIKVSEALLKGVPVIAYRTGGIPYQIVDDFDGYLVPTHHIYRVAELMEKIVFDKENTVRLSMNAKTKLRENVLTPSNVYRWNTIMLEEDDIKDDC